MTTVKCAGPGLTDGVSSGSAQGGGSRKDGVSQMERHLASSRGSGRLFGPVTDTRTGARYDAVLEWNTSTQHSDIDPNDSTIPGPSTALPVDVEAAMSTLEKYLDLPPKEYDEQQAKQHLEQAKQT